MNLTEAQQQVVKRWLDEGLTLAAVQKRLETEFQLRLTYLEVRMLMADLSLMPKDTELQPRAVLGARSAPVDTAPATSGGGRAAPEPWPDGPAGAPPPGGGGVTLRVDQITKPGALVSGTVTFSDGQSAQWYLDQTGRLGLMPSRQGYRPSAADVQEFQAALEGELHKLGM